jgi:hypothetical protein
MMKAEVEDMYFHLNGTAGAAGAGTKRRHGEKINNRPLRYMAHKSKDAVLMIGEPEHEIDVGQIFHRFSHSGHANHVLAIEEEFALTFGPVGKFIVQKQVTAMKKTRDTITDSDVPVLIEKLTATVTGMIGPEQAKNLRKHLRRRCGLSV